MIIEEIEDFHKWLIEELTPICDADPSALAKYVLALLRKPHMSVDEVRKFSLEQLDVFLGSNTVRFVEKMFNALKSKSYFEAPVSGPVADLSKEKKEPSQVVASVSSSNNPAEVSIKEENEKVNLPTSSSSISSSTREEQRRRPVTNQLSAPVTERKGHSKEDFPSTGEKRNENPLISRSIRKRISPPPAENKEKAGNRDVREHRTRRSRSPPARGSSRDRDRRSGRSGGSTNVRRTSPAERHRTERRRSRTRSRSMDRDRRERDRNGETRKRRCKNFELKGLCFRGDQCPYDHGPDPVVMDETALEGMVKFDVAKTNFSVPPPGYNPVNPPPPGVPVENMYIHGSVEGYNPEAPAIASNFTIPPPPLPVTAGTTAWRPPFSVQNVSFAPQGVIPVSQQTNRGTIRGRGRGRGGRVYQNFGNRNPELATLQVKKIPPEFNNIAKLNEHFSTFGTVDNIQVRFNSEPDTALITYSSRAEAMNAYTSPTPVLNNRFIKVFWHNPENSNPEGEFSRAGAVANVTGVSKTVVEKPKIATLKESKFVSAETQEMRAKRSEASEKYKNEKSQLTVLVDLQRRKTELLEKLMEKQKQLLVKARTSPEDKDKKQATKLVKHIHQKIKACKEEADQLLLSISEKTKTVDDALSYLDSLKNSKKEPSPELQENKAVESRKRKASNEISDTISKFNGVVIVKGIKSEDIDELMTHMEQFGETLDMNVSAEDEIAIATIPYRRAVDAIKAVKEGKLFKGSFLDMDLMTKIESDVLTTDAHMTANELLANIPLEIESDEDDS
ncbi:unnamed protein product [Caenorhabditis auriculariae]|uniref:C3H1-type domain-containing protein n=1 Tax=Caenorhabditis auriculariae TaxID=2777116 RepID=A0A8S1GY99_9PELO|nr:unnamed protein product [Caenorhabditis auriculariae]